MTLDILAKPLWHNAAVVGRVGVARPIETDAEVPIPAATVDGAVREPFLTVRRLAQGHRPGFST